MAYTGYPVNGWYGNGNGGYAYFRFAVESAYNAGVNTSAVSIKLQVKVTGNATYCWPYVLGEGTLTYGGTTFTFPGSGYSIPTPAKDTWYTLQYGGSDAVWTKTVNHSDSGSASITLSLSGIRLLYSSDKLYYITLGGTNSVTVDLSQNRTFTLSVSAGTGSTITVKKNGAALANGASITYGDVLTVTFSANSGYNLATHTLNGSTFTSGNTHTVTGNVAVASTATPKGYTLTISPGANSSITVKKNGSAISSGATVYAGDVLAISATAAAGYSISGVTVNGNAIANNSSYTVGSAAVTVACTATQNPPVVTDGGVWIYTNGAWSEYQAYIYANGAWAKYQPYIYNNNGWVKY